MESSYCHGPPRFWILRPNAAYSDSYSELPQKDCMTLSDQIIKWPMKKKIENQMQYIVSNALR